MTATKRIPIARDTYRYPLRRDLDSYGLPVPRDQKRHPDCHCVVQCAGRFKCTSPDHVGNRYVPWCVGATDEYPDYCSDCWLKAMKREGKL